MPHETVTLFFAMLAVGLVVVCLAVLVLAVVDRADRTGLVASVRSVAVEVAAAVAVTATLGSLYLSEIVGFLPCRMCWVQRAFMYPAALVLVAALALRRRSLVLIGGLLALGGLPVSLYHRYEQHIGTSPGFCDPTNPCSFVYVRHFGFITIPTMAAAGFFGILVLTALHLLIGGTVRDRDQLTTVVE